MPAEKKLVLTVETQTFHQICPSCKITASVYLCCTLLSIFVYFGRSLNFGLNFCKWNRMYFSTLDKHSSDSACYSSHAPNAQIYRMTCKWDILSLLSDRIQRLDEHFIVPSLPQKIYVYILYNIIQIKTTLIIVDYQDVETFNQYKKTTKIALSSMNVLC